VRVQDIRKILAAAPLNEDDYIYEIWLELKDIVEQGGPILGGVLVVNQIPNVSDSVPPRNIVDRANIRDNQRLDGKDSNRDNQQNRKIVTKTTNKIRICLVVKMFWNGKSYIQPI
jgi:hypothetical protein